MKVVLIDYGAGNTQSVKFAFERLGVSAILSSKPEDILSADKVVFPGVGHAKTAMQMLTEKKLDILIPALTQPVLGICLGMQLLCNFSQEGNTKCLGVFNETVQLFEPQLKVPQIGWNLAKPVSNQVQEKYLEVAENYFYFVHSYYVPINKYTTLTCEYGISFSAGMQRNNFYAFQFHPEKSSQAGETLLKKFLEL